VDHAGRRRCTSDGASCWSFLPATSMRGRSTTTPHDRGLLFAGADRPLVTDLVRFVTGREVTGAETPVTFPDRLHQLQPLVLPQLGQAWQEPARCIWTPHIMQ
jgi:hypothetical protein